MRVLLKAAAVALPFLVVFLVLRACSANDAVRWRDRVAEVDPAAKLVVDEEDMIVIAPHAIWSGVTREVRRLREALIRDYGDLLGRGRDQRMVIVVFSSEANLKEHAGRTTLMGDDWVEFVHGYTDPVQAAIFLPADSDITTLRHETVHWVVNTSHGGLVRHSPWLNEGLAQLFERYVPEQTPPGVDDTHRIAASHELPDGRFDVDRLIGITDYGQFVTEDGSRNYLEALLLTAFLFEERPREKLRAYIDMERTQPRGRARAFRRIYDSDGEAFQRDLRAYVRAIAQSR